MKEQLPNVIFLRQLAEKNLEANGGLTSTAPKPYSRGGEIFMGEQGQLEGGRNMSQPNRSPQNPEGNENLPSGVRQATERLEQASGQGQARRENEARQHVAREALANPDLPIDVRRALEKVIKEDNGRGSAVDQTLHQTREPEEEPQPPPTQTSGAGGAGGGGAGGGRREPPATSATPPSEGSPGDESREGDVEANAYHIDKEKFGITEEPFVNLVDEIEDRIKYGMSDEDKYNALVQGLSKVHSISSNDDPLGQKPLVAEAIREQLDKIFQRRAESAKRALSQDERAQMRIQIEELKKAILEDIGDPEKMDKIEGIIDTLDPNDRIYPHVVAEAIRGVEDRRELDYLVEDVLEYSLERFLNRADAQPLEDYPQFTFTESENIAVITHTARRFDEARRASGIALDIEPGRRDMFKYLTTLNNRRRVMHELFKSMNDLESFTGLITKALRKSGTNFIEKQLVGVTDVQIVYDQILLFLKSVKPQEKGWLLEEDFEAGDRMVRENLERSMNDHPQDFFRSFVKNDGTRGNRPLRQWEINRAFHMGRDLSGATQRRVVYGILGDIPENVDEFLKSVAHEPIARRLAPLKLIPDRFFSQGIARRFISIFKNEQKRGTDGKINYSKYGYIVRDSDGNIRRKPNGEPETRGLFGSSQDDFAILDLGIVDPKSNSWRSRLLFLKNPKFKSADTPVDGKPATIGDYLDATKKEFVKNDLGRHEKKEAIERWNEEIRDKIANQRLFLGVLMRYSGDLSSANKTVIWKNVSKYMPSRIGSLLPNETLEIVDSYFHLGGNREEIVKKWTGVAEKLWIAERMRVKNDAKVLSGESGDLHDLDYYFDKVGLDRDQGEVELVKQVSALGERFASTLSDIKFPFTAFLDDVPETDWERLSDFDFTRILVSDQNAFQEGYGHIMGLFDNPVKKSEDVAKALTEAFEKIKGPPGVPDTQKIFEPIVKATIKMRQMHRSAKWMGTTLTRALRIPTSPIEEYNLQAHIADDEHDTNGILHVLGQAEVLADNPNELDDKGRTQYQRYKEDLDVDTKAVILAYIRLIIQLFGPAFGLEFAKALGIKIEA